MTFRTLRVAALMALFILPGWNGQARTLPVALRPHEDGRPTPQLERGANPAQLLELLHRLDCVEALAAGRFAEGERACSDAIALNPGDSAAYKLRGYGYLLESRFERAETDFHASLRIKPRDSESLAGLAESFSGQGKFAQAVLQFGKAIALAPASAAYWNGRCWARAATGRQLSLALADCNHAMALAPTGIGVLNSRGLVRLRMGQYQAAIIDYSLAVAAKPAQPSAWFGRGLAHMRLGQREAGMADIAQARRADPHIDTIFIQMGLLPQGCTANPQKADCLPTLTEPGKPRAQPWILASWRMDSDDDVMFAIEVGRLNIMLDQAAALLHQPKSERAAPDFGRSPQALRAGLSDVEARFRQLQRLACRSGRLPADSCGPLHLALINAGDPSLAIEELYRHVRPVWLHLCAGHKKACQLE